jgi:hypothetical protein
MTTPPERSAGAAERLWSLAADDPVRELPDIAVLSGAFYRVGVGFAMHCSCGKYNSTRGGSPWARWRKPYYHNVSSMSRPCHQAGRRHAHVQTTVAT